MAETFLQIAPGLAIDERELDESFIRAGGPGGQNVNKVSTAVQLRFNVRSSPSLPEAIRERLERLAGKRLTKEGVLVIAAHRYRTQEMNRADAREKLAALVAEAAIKPPPPRRPTKPTFGSKQRRLAEKSRRGEIKSNRGRPGGED